MQMNIPFNIPPVVGTELEYIEDAVKRRKLCGDNYYTKQCSKLIEENYQAQKALLTPSCTHALELAAILCDIRPGDEVIMPSFTFVSTANAFFLRGAKIKFVDIRPDTQNIDEQLIEKAITDKTKVIVPVHYAGVSCEMDTIMELAERYSLKVVEDAAQGVNAYYHGKALGTIGDFGCYSFHETKNYTMGEGGALIVNSKDNCLRAEIVREKGTNRAEFLLGMVDKYTWVSEGSSYLPSELGAAYLYAQLLEADNINEMRLARYHQYYAALKELADKEKLTLPCVPAGCAHNAHMFYIKVRDIKERTALIGYLKNRGILGVFHYVPLHTSPQGKKCGEFIGEDRYTTDTADRLLRLPMYKDLKAEEVDYVCEQIYEFYRGR